MNLLRKFFITVCLLAAAGMAAADPILVDPTKNGSYAGITITNCYGWCWAETTLAQSLDRPGRMLDIGESWTFDFFTIRIGGLGTAEAVVRASLAFIAPDVFYSSSGRGGFGTFLGIFSNGYLRWRQPGAYTLRDGSKLYVRFQNFYAAGFGNKKKVSATVYRKGDPYVTTVPEPGTLALFGIGLLAIGLVRRRADRKSTTKS